MEQATADLTCGVNEKDVDAEFMESIREPDPDIIVLLRSNWIPTGNTDN